MAEPAGQIPYQSEVRASTGNGRHPPLLRGHLSRPARSSATSRGDGRAPASPEPGRNVLRGPGRRPTGVAQMRAELDNLGSNRNELGKSCRRHAVVFVPGAGFIVIHLAHPSLAKERRWSRLRFPRPPQPCSGTCAGSRQALRAACKGESPSSRRRALAAAVRGADQVFPLRRQVAVTAAFPIRFLGLRVKRARRPSTCSRPRGSQPETAPPSSSPRPTKDLRRAPRRFVRAQRTAVPSRRSELSPARHRRSGWSARSSSIALTLLEWMRHSNVLDYARLGSDPGRSCSRMTAIYGPRPVRERRIRAGWRISSGGRWSHTQHHLCYGDGFQGSAPLRSGHLFDAFLLAPGERGPVLRARRSTSRRARAGR